MKSRHSCPTTGLLSSHGPNTRRLWSCPLPVPARRTPAPITVLLLALLWGTCGDPPLPGSYTDPDEKPVGRAQRLPAPTDCPWSNTAMARKDTLRERRPGRNCTVWPRNRVAAATEIQLCIIFLARLKAAVPQFQRCPQASV